MGLRYVEAEDLENLLVAAEKILSRLDKPIGWSLVWDDASNLQRAVERIRGG
jgi:hypothetical protein